MRKSPGKESGEDLNVRKVHGQIWRELPEPWEQESRVPPWLKHLVYAPLAIWAIWYLIYYSGGFEWDNLVEGGAANQLIRQVQVEPDHGTAEEPTTAIPDSAVGAQDSGGDAPAAVTVDAGRSFETGGTIYAQACAACHQPDGNGLPVVFPPLAGSDWVTGDETRLALVVLHGLMGPILVNDEPWDGVMPGQGAMLTDRQIADVLTFVRASWGNDAGPVDADLISILRQQHQGQQPWTAEALDAALENN